MSTIRKLALAILLLPTLASSTAPKQMWVAYHVRFEHMGHTEIAQSRSLWTEGTTIVTDVGKWQFLLEPRLDAQSGDSGLLRVSVQQANAPKVGATSGRVLDTDMPFQVGMLTERRQQDGNGDLELTLMVSPLPR